MLIYLDLVEALAYLSLLRRARIATQHLDEELAQGLHDAELHLAVRLAYSMDNPDTRLN